MGAWLTRLNRLVLVAWTVGLATLVVEAPSAVPASVVPTAGPLAALSVRQGQALVLGAAWLSGVVLTLAWQRTLWSTMASGAGLAADGGRLPGVSLPAIRGTVRGRIVTATAVRRGWSPLARLRVETSIDVADPPASLELEVTTASDPDGRVLFEAPDADRRYVLREGSGDLEAVLPTEYRADLVDVDTPGVLRVEGTTASFELASLPFDAARLKTAAETTVKLAEQVERAAGGRRNA